MQNLERYIGFNDNIGNDCNHYVYTDGYEDGIEDVLMREIRSRGGLVSMMEPCTDPGFEGHTRVVITLGPVECVREEEKNNLTD